MTERSKESTPKPRLPASGSEQSERERQAEHDRLDEKLDEALEMSFPASDPIAV